MLTVWKFPLEIVDQQTIHVPGRSFRPLSVQEDKSGNLCLWAAVRTELPPLPVDLYIRGTGHDLESIPKLSVYLGTVVERSRPLVWHVFYKTEMPPIDFPLTPRPQVPS